MYKKGIQQPLWKLVDVEFGPDPRQENSHDFKSFVSIRNNYVMYLSCIIS